MSKEAMKITGQLKLRIFRNGILVDESISKNLVVDTGKDCFLGNIATPGYSKKVIKIGVGENGTEPAANDGDILNPSFMKDIGAVSTGPCSATWPFSIGTGEANDLVIREYLLMAGDGIGDLVLVARRTRADLLKTSDISIEGEWTIQL